MTNNAEFDISCPFCNEEIKFSNASPSNSSVDRSKFVRFCEACGFGQLRENSPKRGFCVAELPRLHKHLLNRFMQIVEIRYAVSCWGDNSLVMDEEDWDLDCIAPCLLLDSEWNVSELLKASESELMDLHEVSGDAIILTSQLQHQYGTADAFTAYFSSGVVRSGHSGDDDHLDALGYLCEAEAARHDPLTDFRHDFDCWAIYEREGEADLFSNFLSDPFSLIEDPVIMEKFGKTLFSSGFTTNKAHLFSLLRSAR